MEGKKIFAIFGILFFITFVVADVVSFNSGGGNGSIITPGGVIENFFSQVNRIPVVTNVILSSTSGNNLTNDNLSVSYISSDSDGNFFTNITDWRIYGVSILLLNMPFDKNVVDLTSGSVKDYSTNANNGTLGAGVESNSPVWNSTCRVGGCYQFDGNGDTIQVSSGLGITNNTNFTFSHWIKTTQSAAQVYTIGNAGAGSGYRFGIGSGRVAFLIGNGTSLSEATCGTATANDGNWHMITGVFSRGNFFYCYVDGVLNGSVAISTYFGMSDSSPGIGAPPCCTDFNGSIDEIQIFNRSLTSGQIMLLYNAGLNGDHMENLFLNETEKEDIWSVSVTPNDRISDGVTVLSNTLSIENAAPFNPTNVSLISLNGRNESDTALECSAFISDSDDINLDVSVNWFNNSISFLNQTFNGESNGTTFSSELISGNLTLGDTWMCSVRTYDGDKYSGWSNSNNLTIIDITSPNITIISPNSSFNYTTLDIDFNISVIENEEVSICFYSLDSATNVTMNQTNATHFWFEPSLGPGPHFLEYYCNDTSNNWGYNSTNFTILNSAAISILLSDDLSFGVKWNVLNLPTDDLDAIGNNGNGSTYYFLNISATNTLVDIYVRADGDLYTDSLDTLLLGNETYSYNSSDSNLSNSQVFTMTTNYTLVGDSLDDGSAIYFKFYLDAPATQPAGIYLNQLQFKAVREGESP